MNDLFSAILLFLGVAVFGYVGIEEIFQRDPNGIINLFLGVLLVITALWRIKNE